MQLKINLLFERLPTFIWGKMFLTFLSIIIISYANGRPSAS